MVGYTLLVMALFTTVNMSNDGSVIERHTSPVLLTTLQQIIDEENKTIEIKKPPEKYILPESTFVSQTYNNCGPAALSMVFSTYGKVVSQDVLASEMRPFNSPFGGVDDKSIFPNEFVNQAKNYGFESLHRPNGDIDLLKQFVANDIPVVVRTWLNPGEDIGHFRIIRGYNDSEKIFIQDDSYQGKNLSYSYDQVLSMWQPFNYGYILVYPKEKQPIVDAILGTEQDEKIAYHNAINRAEQELEINPDDVYAQLNKSTSYYHLEEYKKAVASYNKARDGLPDRILWYQLEPLFAYQKTGDFDRVFEITEAILNSGNPAYSELYQMRGEMYLTRGDTETAKAEFEKAVFYNTNYEPAKQALEKI